MTPDGPPLIGRTEFSNLYLNTGHGTLGWTMACGSARVLSDIISSKVPDIDVRELGPERKAFGTSGRAFPTTHSRSRRTTSGSRDVLRPCRA